MLANIISNIILAVIAIGMLYTLGPLLKDIFMKTKKRNVSEDEFDQMIKRKVERFKGSPKAAVNSAALDEMIRDTESKKKKPRSDWDYLVETNFFKNEEEVKKIESLKSCLDWGSGAELDKIKLTFKTQLGIEVEDDLNIQIKRFMTKSSLLKVFPKKGVSLEDLINKFCVFYLLEQIENDEEKYINHLVKKTTLHKNALVPAVSLIFATDAQKENIIHSFIEEDYSEKFDPIITCIALNSISDLLNHILKQVDVLLPLIDVEGDKIFNPKKPEDHNKRKYKKLAALYHPDKWSYAEKTSIISDRLENNFNYIKKEYDKLS